MLRTILTSAAALCLAAGAAFADERGFDRPGGDYRSFDLARANVQACKTACMRDGKCKAWTYVRPGVQGPKARCWLKNVTPRKVRNRNTTSGVVPRRVSSAVGAIGAPGRTTAVSFNECTNRAQEVCGVRGVGTVDYDEPTGSCSFTCEPRLTVED